jgi:hypothetical protein
VSAGGRDSVVLYSRPGCHLCAEAREAILALLRRHDGLELREVDIESDERLLAAYLGRIPVVEVDGEVVSELILDRQRLAAKLDTLRP